MEDSFRVRVDRAFGTLTTTSFSGVSPALWCLTDEEIERREWNRSKDDDVEIEKELNRNDAVVSGTFISSNQPESDLKELSDDEESGNEEDVSAESEDAADEFLDVRANMGRDITLDYEEDVDEYDVVAIGKDHDGDRLYMRDAKYADYGMHKELPSSFKSSIRDHRANHEAAYARLKEDAEASRGFETLQLSDNTIDPDSITEANINNEHRLSRAGDDLISTIKNGAICEQTSEVSGYLSVPDYIKNPSRYTHYTFDSTDDVDDQSNRKAYTEFFNSLRKMKSGDNNSSLDDGASVRTPSILFTPRKKSEGDTTMKNENNDESKGSDVKNTGPSLVLTVDEAQEAEFSAMEEDDELPAVVNKGFTSQKSSGRKFRTRTSSDVDHDMRGYI